MIAKEETASQPSSFKRKKITSQKFAYSITLLHNIAQNGQIMAYELLRKLGKEELRALNYLLKLHCKYIYART